MARLMDATQKRQPVFTRFFPEQEQWFRFSSYEIVSLRPGFLYVRPHSGAQLSWYKPFDHYPKILQDYLDLAHGLNDPEGPMDDAQFRERINRHARRVLEFAHEYGALGLLWQCAPQFRWNGEAESAFLPPSVWAASLPLTAAELASGMDLQRLLSLFLITKRFPSSEIVFRKTNLAEYGEPVMSVARDARDLLRIHSDWQRFQSGGHSPDDVWVDASGRKWQGKTWRQMLVRDIKLDNIGLTVRLNRDQIKLDYTFPSLISALRIMLALNVSSGSEQIRSCALKECGRPFVPKSERGRYCSDSHSNLDRQRMFLKDNPDYYNKRQKRQRLQKGTLHGTTKTKK
jgi:hypothetical protein